MKSAHDQAVVLQAASVCLQYPDDTVLARLPLVRRAVDELPGGAARERLTAFLDSAAATAPSRMAQHYVEVFDMRRRCCLYLTWWTDGETRRRGSALAALKARYRTAGVELDTPELPDFLPAVLEFAATADLAAGLQKRDRRRLAGLSSMVFQQHHLFPHLSVLENVTVGPTVVQRVPRADADERAMALLARVGLAEKADARPSELSGGQQQRVGIVRALAMRPQMLLFDEPTSALDPELVGEVLAIVRDLAERGTTMVLATHEMSFAREVATSVCFLSGGRILEQGPPAQIFTEPREERTRQFLRRVLPG